MDLPMFKISIITPNYNYENFIGKTIDSVFNQDYDNIEHIVVDDCSTDNSVAIIEKKIEQYGLKLKLIKNKINKGQTATINTGLLKASGNIFGWINSDDFYNPNIMRRVSKTFERNPNIDIIIGDINVIDYNENSIYRNRYLPFNYDRACILGFTNFISSNAIFWRKSLMNKVGLLDESLKCNMDGEFFSRLTYGSNVKYIPLVIANFRKHITIASKQENNWDDIVKDEFHKELESSYQRTFWSKVIPIKYSYYLKILYRMQVKIIKIFTLKSLKMWMEKNKYKAYYASK